MALLVAVLLCIVAYANGLLGDFVYDDDLQIVENFMIQDGRYFWKALASDVWAYRGDLDEAVSNYWRPGFVLWLTAQYRAFGLNPVGWHAMNLLLHVLVVTFAFRVARRLGATTHVAAAATWIFAVHPSHVESVTWISGSPDLLMAAFALAAYLFYLGNPATLENGGGEPRRSSTSRRVYPGGLRLPALSALLFAGAMFCKEVAIFLPLVIFGTEWCLTRTTSALTTRQRLLRALRAILPYMVVVVCYVLLRLAVVGVAARAAADAPGPVGFILTLPGVLAFYLRQALLPIRLSPIYSLRVISPETATLQNVLLPLLLVAFVAVVSVRWWRRGPLYAVGLLWFALPLLPALNLWAFQPEELVHDRYLYLPLFGAWLMLTARLDEVLTTYTSGGVHSRRLRPDPGSYVGARRLLGASLVVAMFMTAGTIRYNTAWRDDLSLWAWAAARQPDSADAHHKYALLLYKHGRFDEALQHVQQSLRIYPGHVQGLALYGAISEDRGEYETAEACFTAVLETNPYHEAVIDRLAIVYQQQDRPNDAVAVYEQARRDMPHRRAKYGFNIAVVAYQAGDAARALVELESIRDLVETDPDRTLLEAWFRLGMLYEQFNRPHDARDAYARFLTLTQTAAPPDLAALRPEAHAALQRLP
jgi:tetratricopeptide (TPR) repeat protein